MPMKTLSDSTAVEARKERLLREMLGPRPAARAGAVDLVAFIAILLLAGLAASDVLRAPESTHTAAAPQPPAAYIQPVSITR
jgi:hypothetical protein